MPKIRSEAEVIAAIAADPVLVELAGKAESPCWLVGGAVRDLFLGRDPGELDVAVEDDLGPLITMLGGAEQVHGRFGTARVRIGGRTVDLARTRRERYERPGALPQVEPAPIRADLGRRDFTINAIAVSLGRPPELIDPYDGREDLAAGLLRVLHERSFADDPARALRAARYAARLGFELDSRTAELLAKTDLETVSGERFEAEMLRLASEPDAIGALTLLAGWELIDAGRFDASLVESVERLTSEPRWRDLLDRPRALLAAAIGMSRSGSGGPDPREAAAEIAALEPSSPSQAVAAARHSDPLELAIARALGATWLDRWAEEWRHVRLEIDGDDLLAEGVPRGPAIGVGLEAALAARLDGEAPDAASQLDVALEAAGAF